MLRKQQINQIRRSFSTPQTPDSVIALSEAEKTVLIIDQLQVADFRDHIRLYHFVENTAWEYSLATLNANPRNFLLLLVSEEPLYHSLQKASFRIWADRGNTPLDYRPEDFGLDASAMPMMSALSELFSTLATNPTRSEYERLLQDIVARVRTEDYLRHSIYGWTEGVDRDTLYSPRLQPSIEQAMQAIRNYIGHDEIEVGSIANS